MQTVLASHCPAMDVSSGFQPSCHNIDVVYGVIGVPCFQAFLHCLLGAPMVLCIFILLILFVF
jgi:hypothetical protein